MDKGILWIFKSTYKLHIKLIAIFRDDGKYIQYNKVIEKRNSADVLKPSIKDLWVIWFSNCGDEQASKEKKIISTIDQIVIKINII